MCETCMHAHMITCLPYVTCSCVACVMLHVMSTALNFISHAHTYIYVCVCVSVWSNVYMYSIYGRHIIVYGFHSCVPLQDISLRYMYIYTCMPPCVSYVMESYCLSLIPLVISLWSLQFNMYNCVLCLGRIILMSPLECCLSWLYMYVWCVC